MNNDKGKVEGVGDKNQEKKRRLMKVLKEKLGINDLKELKLHSTFSSTDQYPQLPPPKPPLILNFDP